MRGHLGLPDLELAEVAPVVPGVLAGVPVVLHGEDPAARARTFRQGNREEPRPGVQVDDVRARAWFDPVEDRLEQRRGCTDVGLPEHPGRRPVAPPRHLGLHGRRSPSHGAVDHETRVQHFEGWAGPGPAA